MGHDMGNPLKDFSDASALLDTRLQDATKADVAECARLLALNLAHYKIRYGELPLSEQENMAETDQISPAMADLLASGMLEMIAALEQVTGNVTDGGKTAH